MIVYHVTTAAALPSILNQGLHPRIGPRAADLGEEHPRVYCFTCLEAVEHALSNWLGDEFEDEEAILLELSLPEGTALDSDVEWEVAVRDAIPASCIQRRWDLETLASLDDLEGSSITP